MITAPRVRIAPSPSGYLHVGTARTAIFNWLFARRFGGKFLIRIEDTDAERSDSSLVEPIISALRWLGIESDEPIIYQSSRLHLYRDFATKLLETGHGYHCFCTVKELEAEREAAMANKEAPKYSRKCLRLDSDTVAKRIAGGESFAIRLKVPDGDVSFDDMVSGKITRAAADIEDLIVARSDGSATYNLAVVVDDHSMGISHVIRGNDHISNTFKQILLYRAFGWDVPRFGHVPLILRPDKKKVSKRLGDKDVAAYQDEGILPQAMFNYLCLLGWSPKNDREIYTVADLISIFIPDNLNASNAVFDEDKLESFNKSHIQLLTNSQLADLVAPQFVAAGIADATTLTARRDYLETVCGLLKERVRRLQDFRSLGAYFFRDDFTYDSEAELKQFSPTAADLMEQLVAAFEKSSDFAHDQLETALSSVAESAGVKKAALIHPTRLAVSGMPVGPGLYDLLAALGREQVTKRMKKTIAYIRAKS